MALDCKTGALIALLAFNFPVQAAYIGASMDKADHRVILIEGAIVEGDQYRFEEVWAAHPDTEAVDLDSPGGLILPALHIGVEIRRGGLATMVSRNSTCASACADIWLAGIHRILPEGARLGFHGIYGNDGKTLTMTGAGNGLVGAYMARLGYGDSAVIFATGARPNEIAWLDPSNPFNMNGITFEASPPKQLRVSEVWVADQMKAVEMPPPPLPPKPPELPKRSEVKPPLRPAPSAPSQNLMRFSSDPSE